MIEQMKDLICPYVQSVILQFHSSIGLKLFVILRNPEQKQRRGRVWKSKGHTRSHELAPEKEISGVDSRHAGRPETPLLCFAYKSKTLMFVQIAFCERHWPAARHTDHL